MRNHEFKTRLDDQDRVLARIRDLGGAPAGDLGQTDTYFSVHQGRLKLRETEGSEAQLVYYQRDEAEAGSRPSDYELTPVPDAASLKAVLSMALGVLAVVRKRRMLLLLDTTRIHLDNVEGMGRFLEIEAPVLDGSAEADIAAGMQALIEALGFSASAGIHGSYLDLVIEARA